MAEAFYIHSLNEKSAGRQIDWMEEYWQMVDKEEAQILTNEGKLVIAGLRNSDDGHVVVIIPGNLIQRPNGLWPSGAGGSIDTCWITDILLLKINEDNIFTDDKINKLWLLKSNVNSKFNIKFNSKDELFNRLKESGFSVNDINIIYTYCKNLNKYNEGQCISKSWDDDMLPEVKYYTPFPCKKNISKKLPEKTDIILREPDYYGILPAERINFDKIYHVDKPSNGFSYFIPNMTTENYIDALNKYNLKKVNYVLLYDTDRDYINKVKKDCNISYISALDIKGWSNDDLYLLKQNGLTLCIGLEINYLNKDYEEKINELRVKELFDKLSVYKDNTVPVRIRILSEPNVMPYGYNNKKRSRIDYIRRFRSLAKLIKKYAYEKSINCKILYSPTAYSSEKDGAYYFPGNDVVDEFSPTIFLIPDCNFPGYNYHYILNSTKNMYKNLKRLNKNISLSFSEFGVASSISNVMVQNDVIIQTYKDFFAEFSKEDIKLIMIFDVDSYKRVKERKHSWQFDDMFLSFFLNK